jgi:ABC-type transporter Mla MlaB component
MLRITVHDNPESLTFQLEGRLAGPWVREAEECRQRTLASRRGIVVRIDLAGVTFIDDAGKTYLAAMHRLGAEFVAADCLTKAVVAEITGAPIPDRGHAEGEGETRTERNRSAT